MNDISTPFFTVVIPTFNRSELLREAVQSVLKQTFDDFELLVVDDHSTDDTREVIRSFRDSRINYILNDRTRGGAGTRNAGIFRGHGQWVAFLDDDDVWMPEKLEMQYKKLQVVDDTVGLIYSGYTSYNLTKKNKVFVPQKEGWIQNDLLYRNCIGTYSTVSIRTKLLRDLGGLDERFPALQDRELFVRVAGVYRVSFINETLVHVQRSHEDRISLDPQRRLTGNLLFCDKYNKLIMQNYRLRHIWRSRIFLSAALQLNISEALKTLPWTLLGLFVDPLHFLKISRRLIALFCIKYCRSSLTNCFTDLIRRVRR